MTEPTKRDLISIQEQNLRMLEAYGNKIKVSGVPILQCLNYKIIQIMNNIAMRSLLGEGDNAQGNGNNG